MGNSLPKESASNWDPGKGATIEQGNAVLNKLMNTEASDAKDTMTGTNELKQYSGGSGKPSGPFGVQGKEF